MTANVAAKDYFTKIENANWNQQRITSDGDVVQRKPWLGRLCSCMHIHRGYDVVKAVEAVKNRSMDYLAESSGPSDRVVREHTVHSAINSLNTLIERVNAKKTENKIELIDFVTVNAVKVVKKEESATRGAVKDSSKAAEKRTHEQDVPASAVKRNKKDAATIREGELYVQNFKKTREISSDD